MASNATQSVKALKESAGDEVEDEHDLDDTGTRQFKAPIDDADIDEYIVLQDTLHGLHALPV